MKAPLVTALAGLALVFGFATCCAKAEPAAAQVDDPLYHPNDRSFLDGYEPVLPSGEVQVVVEIPAGTTAKWEVTKPSGELRWEIKNGKPRIVAYLGYPGNYGMIPRTLLPKELGGDGDPLDVIVLGDSVPRGSVLPTHIIGVMRMLDGGEQDDKLIAVRSGTPFAEVRSLAQLRKEFAGVDVILEQWFSNYKGPGIVQVPGFAEATEANRILQESIKAFASH
ncbi:MAG: inorganic diphosphatase [Planctomycetes bacterium]|nr:inorganic diphosphatase [Planctomycetota bacterium]MCB9909898.1 inorganic diphosphatase [Planctomycetota bacterium]MCB9912965.1 inorganic diphosphatase [Planctomycetota bacterium]HPF15616.1 inorganic diphosphatase [Planctomycetota bacterium]HRV80275.1 inorganic diphosphatase [Planctomycetota bacterium]